jgi:hypothetical protein
MHGERVRADGCGVHVAAAADMKRPEFVSPGCYHPTTPAGAAQTVFSEKDGT